MDIDVDTSDHGTSNSTADESQEMPLSAPPSSEDIEDNPQPQTSPGVLTELFKWLVSVDPCFSVYYERFFSNKIDTLLLISVLQKDDLDFLEVTGDHATKMLEAILFLRTSIDPCTNSDTNESVSDTQRFLATAPLNDAPKFRKPQNFKTTSDPSYLPFPSPDFAFFYKFLLDNPAIRS